MPVALVVDRNVVVRNVIRSILMPHGFEMLDAANAAEALALCRSLCSQPIDVLIVEHALGPETGKAVAGQILESRPEMQVLVISDLGNASVLEEDGLPPGASFLQKPFTAAQLLAAIRNLLEPKIQ